MISCLFFQNANLCKLRQVYNPLIPIYDIASMCFGSKANLEIHNADDYNCSERPRVVQFPPQAKKVKRCDNNLRKSRMLEEDSTKEIVSEQNKKK